MSHGEKASPWSVMRRCLALVRRLLRGPATREELIHFVRQQANVEPYSPDPQAAHLAFRHDLQRLRGELGADVAYDRSAERYILTSPGEAGMLDLSDEYLAALNILYSAFEEHELTQAPVRPLLDHLVSLLSAERQQALARLAQVMRVEMPELDEGRIPLRVWKAVERATRRRHQLAFHHYSPQQPDRQPRYWVVAPVELRFYRGHWYLHCWTVSWRDHTGEGYEANYRRFRLQYIADDDRLAVLPTRVAVEHRGPPRTFVHYLLRPPVGRGDISRHFQEMTVERRPDGSAEVKGFCDDAWEAVRTLLGYGESCVVLGGDEVLSLVRKRVRGMAENYGFSDRS